jgi:hypothetical protein
MAKEHNHVKKLRRLIAQGKIPIEVGTVRQVDVAHGSWCRLLRKGQRCTCDSDIRMRWSLEAASQNEGVI